MGVISKIGTLLGYKPALDVETRVSSGLGFGNRALEAGVWYTGDVTGLTDLYKTFGSYSGIVQGNRFWHASLSNSTIRKMHTGLPKLMVDKLAGIVVSDMLDPQLDESAQEKWKLISSAVDLKGVTKRGVTDTLVMGDGAFKLSWDTSVSDYPIVEFVDALHVDYRYRHGFLSEIIFKEEFEEDKEKYLLTYHYGYGYIRYELTRNRGVETMPLPLSDTAYTKDLEDIDLASYGLDGVMLAVPFKVFESSKFKGRGESIFEGKIDIFDSLDEVVSTWLDAIRAGRVMKYIPTSLIPVDPRTGARLYPDPFNQWQEVGDALSEGEDREVKTSKAEINYQSFLSSYMAFLDMALQGVISPSTLGIDVKKLDNAESQREKEKTTLYTRDEIVTSLERALPAVVVRLLYVYDIINSNVIDRTGHDYQVSISFGQYANPSFETLLSTIGTARGNGVISLEWAVEELWGDSKTAEEKEQEVMRLRLELEAVNGKGVDANKLNSSTEETVVG